MAAIAKGSSDFTGHPSLFQKVLIVDDHKDVLWTFKVTLEKKFDLLLATSSHESVKLIQSSENISALIVDFYLHDVEGGDGLTVAKEFRSKFPNSPIFVISGEMKPNPRVEELLALPMVRAFPKPFSMKALTQTLAESLTNS